MQRDRITRLVDLDTGSPRPITAGDKLPPRPQPVRLVQTSARPHRPRQLIEMELPAAEADRLRLAAARLGSAEGRRERWSDEKMLRFLLDFAPLAEFVDRIRSILKGGPRGPGRAGRR